MKVSSKREAVEREIVKGLMIERLTITEKMLCTDDQYLGYEKVMDQYRNQLEEINNRLREWVIEEFNK